MTKNNAALEITKDAEDTVIIDSDIESIDDKGKGTIIIKKKNDKTKKA